MSALDDFLGDMRAELRDDRSALAGDIRWLLDHYEPSLRRQDADGRGPLARQDGWSTNERREHMRRHVEDLEHLPEWLRPELRALLHEGRLT